VAGENFQVFSASMAFSSRPFAQTLNDVNVRGQAVDADGESERAGALILGVAGFFGEFRLVLSRRIVLL
jgi:hypothetical protein